MLKYFLYYNKKDLKIKIEIKIQFLEFHQLEYYLFANVLDQRQIQNIR